MTREQSFLIQCLGDFCNGEKTQRPSGDGGAIDTDAFCRIAEEQCVDGIVFDQCASWLGMHAGLRKGFLGLVFLSANHADILQEIMERFRREGIRVVCMKGSVFRDSYPVPELRSMGDVDLIIHPEDQEKADRVMMEGMHCQRLINNHDVWAYWIGDLMYEIHTHMFYEFLANRVDYRSYFDRVWGSARPGTVFGIQCDNLLVPDAELHLLYLLTHTAKHIINNGTGFRAFLDMVMFVRAHGTELDRGHLEQELSRLDLLDFARTCFTLCRRWFRVEMPLDGMPLSEEFLARITEKVFRDGIFGLGNAENAVAKPAKLIQRAGGSYGASALKYTVRLLFPPYRNMQLIPWYSWVDGKPWLLPAAWVYRWFYCLSHKQAWGRELIREPYEQKDRVRDREQMLREWGL